MNHTWEGLQSRRSILAVHTRGAIGADESGIESRTWYDTHCDTNESISVSPKMENPNGRICMWHSTRDENDGHGEGMYRLVCL